MIECSELTDNEIEYLQLIMKGYTSSYSIWSYLKQKAEKDPKMTGISYKNVNKRFIKLIKIKAIEEIQLPGTSNIHGRKDFRVSLVGLELLIPYFLDHLKEIESVVSYMDKFGLDKNFFGASLLEKFTNMTELLNMYQDNTSVLFNDSYWSKLVSEKKLPSNVTSISTRFDAAMEGLIERISDSSDSQRAYNQSMDKYQETVAQERKYKSAKELNEFKSIQEVYEFGLDANTTSEYLDVVREKLIHYNVEVKFKFDKDKPIFNLTRIDTDQHKKRDELLVRKDMQKLYRVVDKMSSSQSQELLKKLSDDMDALVMLSSEKRDNYSDNESKTYNIIKKKKPA